MVDLLTLPAEPPVFSLEKYLKEKKKIKSLLYSILSLIFEMIHTYMT